MKMGVKCIKIIIFKALLIQALSAQPLSTNSHKCKSEPDLPDVADYSRVKRQINNLPTGSSYCNSLSTNQLNNLPGSSLYGNTGIGPFSYSNLNNCGNPKTNVPYNSLNGLSDYSSIWNNLGLSANGMKLPRSITENNIDITNYDYGGNMPINVNNAIMPGNPQTFSNMPNSITQINDASTYNYNTGMDSSFIPNSNCMSNNIIAYNNNNYNTGTCTPMAQYCNYGNIPCATNAFNNMPYSKCLSMNNNTPFTSKIMSSSMPGINKAFSNFGNMAANNQLQTNSPNNLLTSMTKTTGTCNTGVYNNLLNKNLKMALQLPVGNSANVCGCVEPSMQTFNFGEFGTMPMFNSSPVTGISEPYTVLNC
ncbi:hypothetical protein K1T71_014164 [Dendrolimus kikuchii]|uniref:Uncharacterized protein n=1 Tax=Dendrolimus kikuchii TaxID=765133 RepID=A0ACC1CFA3_9NEOP|nr:hypothetical protein K1T71_014164 [Dendrolimus kikuchii]